MFAFFFLVSRGKQLVRMDVEAVKQIPPSVAAAATGVFDFQKNCWIKAYGGKIDNLCRPDDLVPVPHHTFFHMLGMCWYILSDRRFANTVRSNCARVCEINAKIHINVESLAYRRLCDHLRNGAYSGQTIDNAKIVDTGDPAYRYFPL